MRCHRCGRESPHGFRFCGFCGSRLADPGPGEIEERKTVSALFCDLAGFTPRAEGLDPEDVHRLLRAYFDGVRGEFERFGGTIAKYIGDAVFVLFGAPRAHEDDPERAVRAALAALDAVAGLNAADPELDLHVHIGVTTGEALVTLQPEGLAWGDTLNTASRIEGAAPPDSILVDDATYRATRHVIGYAAVEPVRAKGIAEPVVVWRPLAPLARPGYDLPVGEAPAPIVGRGAELGLLLDGLDATRARREPHAITLVGEPGIGKSRVVLELFRRLDARPELVHWRQGRSPPYPDGVSFWAFGEVVKQQAGLLATDGAEVAGAKLARAVADLIPAPAEAARVEVHLRSLVGLAEPAETRGEQREAAFAAWRRFVEALAGQRPLVLVLEDVHWADDGLLDFVEYLLDWARDSPVLIVCTARPELLDRRAGWGERDRAATVVLPPLSDPETRELVSGPARPPLADELTEAIVARAAGNPLYAVEFVRMLAGRAPAGAEEALPLPDSLRGIVAARVDSLSRDDKALLHGASVIGRIVWPGALAAVTERPRDWVLDHLATLEEREFVARRRHSSVEHEPEYRFQHVLIRDVAYGEIPRRRRGEIHRRTAQWLESLSPDRAADRAEMLAHHHLCAYEMAQAAGEETEELARTARLALRDAGDRAATLHAFPAAARFFRAALELWPEDDPERPWLLFRLGRAVYSAETAGAAELADAREALLAAGEPGAAAEAEAFLGYLAHHEGRRDRASEHLERAVALVEDIGPTRSKAEVLLDLATHLSTATEHERTIAVATEALEIARALGLDELEARALSITGISRGLSGDAGGREDLERSIAITDRIGSPLSADGYGKLADLEGQMGELHACFAHQALARRHAEAFGHAPFVRWLAAERVGEGYWTGAWDEAVARADAVVAEVEAGAPNFMEGYCRAMRGRIRLARGDAYGARADAARALDFARAAEDLQMLYPALAFGARAELEAGSPELGARLADELLVLWGSKLDAYPASSWVVDLACALDALGRGAELAGTAAAATTATRWLDAVVLLAGGEYLAAAEGFERIGSRPDAALARLGGARELFGAGRAREAQAEHDRAVDFYRAVGASAYLDEAVALAGAFVSGPRPP